MSRFSQFTLNIFRQLVIEEISGFVIDQKSAQILIEKVVSVYQKHDQDSSSTVYHLLKDSELRLYWNHIFATQRAQYIAEWIQPYCHGTVLDLVCGDGSVGAQLEQSGLNVEYGEYQNKLAFGKLNWHRIIGLDTENSYDTVILGSVLHHSLVPNDLLHLAQKLSRRTVIVYENPLTDYFDLELHELIDVFFNQGLNQTGDIIAMSHKTVADWEIELRKIGRIIHADYVVNIPANLIPHSLHIIETV
jgi:hypothetical protein